MTHPTDGSADGPHVMGGTEGAVRSLIPADFRTVLALTAQGRTGSGDGAVLVPPTPGMVPAEIAGRVSVRPHETLGVGGIAGGVA